MAVVEMNTECYIILYSLVVGYVLDLIIGQKGARCEIHPILEPLYNYVYPA